MIYEQEMQFPTSLPPKEQLDALLKHLKTYTEYLPLDPVEFEIAGYMAYLITPVPADYFHTDFILTCTSNMIYVRTYSEFITPLRTPEGRADLLRNLTDADLKHMRSDQLMNDEEYKELCKDPAPTLFHFLAAFHPVKLMEYCRVHYGETGTTNYRTKAQADNAVHEIPSALAVPTMQNYQYVMSLKPFGNAYMQPLASTDGLKFSDGRMYFIGNEIQPVSEVQLQNMVTNEGIESIDLGMLRIFYSIILTEFEKTKCSEIRDVITLYVPDLAESMGLQRNINKAGIQRLIDTVQSFHNIVGIMHGTRNNKPSQSLYPVLNFEGYDDKKNTISFSSPYMNMVIKTVYKLAIRKDKYGEPKLTKRGDPIRMPTHSFLTKTSIVKERNKTAVENVLIIVQLIEQCGNQEPHISALTMIERNPLLEQRLRQAKNKTTLLKRTFETTWRILREQTYLTERYQNIKLPDPDDPAMIPSVKNLDTIVFSFPHHGKK